MNLTLYITYEIMFWQTEDLKLNLFFLVTTTMFGNQLEWNLYLHPVILYLSIFFTSGWKEKRIASGVDKVIIRQNNIDKYNK